MNIRVVTALLALSLVSLAGCTATRPLSVDELRARGEEHLARLDARRIAPDRPVSLETALAVALEQNARFRLQKLDQAIARGNRHITSAEMLPDITDSAGYHQRNNDQGSYSRNLDTGNISLESSTSSERENTTERLEASWNVIDFGIAWLSARTYGDKQRIAEEEQRRISHQVAADLVYAHDKALAFQRVRPRLESARVAVEEALAQSNALLAQRVRDPLTELEYRSGLLLILKRINQLTLEMDQARDDLSELLGLPAGSELLLEDSAAAQAFVLPPASLTEWQKVALAERPEMRQAMYESRDARRDKWKGVLQALPNLALTYGLNYDSNTYLYNNHWQDSSAAISFSLIKLSTLPLRYRVGKRREEVALLQEQLLATAVLSQVSIAQKARDASSRASCLSSSLARLDDSRMEYLQARAAAAAIDRLTMMRADVENVLMVLEAAMDRANRRRAELMLASAVGVGAMPDDIIDQEPEVRAARIADWMSSGMQARARDLLREVAGATTASGTEGQDAASNGPAVAGGSLSESEECRW